MKQNKNFLSLLTLIAFGLLAVASGGPPSLQFNSFYRENGIENDTEQATYLVKNDGTKVYGKKINWQGGAILKDQIKIDDQKFPSKEIRGFKRDTVYYGRLGYSFIKRVVHGKLNIYYDVVTGTSTSTDSQGNIRSRNTSTTVFYAQQGEKGEMIRLYDIEDIKKLVEDCPLAASMVDIHKKQLKKELKNDRQYLTKLINIYNNDCRPVK